MRAAQALERVSAPRRLRQYPEYKGSGVEWLGEIPAHWNLAPLYARYEVALGKMLDAKRVTGEFGGPYLRNVDVQWDLVNAEKLPEMDFAPWERDRYLLRPGDLLVCEGGEVGRTAIWRGELEECFYQKAIHRVRPRSGNDEPRFLYYLMYAMAKGGIFVAGGNPNTIDHLTGVQLRRYRFPFAPFDEQRAIAAFLDRKSARIDALVAKKERLIELLQEQRTALITRAVTKGLDANAPMKDSGVEWLGAIPAHWDVNANRLLFEERNERGRDDLPILEVSIGSGVRVREFSDSKVEQRSDDLGSYKVAEVGDVSFNKMRMWQGAVGMAAVHGLVSPDYIVARPRASTSPRYFTSLFRTPIYMAEVYRRSHGIVDDRNRLYWDDFKAILSPVPPLKDQDEIALFLSSETHRIDDLMTKMRSAIDGLSELRLALISAAVTGKIDVRSE